MKTFSDIREGLFSGRLGSMIDKAHKQQQLHTRGGQGSRNAHNHHHEALSEFERAKDAHKNGDMVAAKHHAKNAISHSLYTSVYDGYRKGTGDKHHNKLAKHLGMGDMNKPGNSDQHMKRAQGRL